MAKFGEWIPITYREMTDEEKQAKADKLRVDPEALTDNIIYTCEMPDDDQQVIITTNKNDVFMTKFYKYGIYEYFEMFEDPGDALAWMPGPEPFNNSEAKYWHSKKEALDLANKALEDRLQGEGEELISREALKKEIIGLVCDFESIPIANAIVKKIDSAPTVAYPFEKIRTMLCRTCQAHMRVEPERQPGEWRLTLTGDVICSVCKLPRRDTRIDHIQFCNHCGADMRGNNEKRE